MLTLTYIILFKLTTNGQKPEDTISKNNTENRKQANVWFQGPNRLLAVLHRGVQQVLFLQLPERCDRAAAEQPELLHLHPSRRR